MRRRQTVIAALMGILRLLKVFCGVLANEGIVAGAPPVQPVFSSPEVTVAVPRCGNPVLLRQPSTQ